MPKVCIGFASSDFGEFIVEQLGLVKSFCWCWIVLSTWQQKPAVMLSSLFFITLFFHYSMGKDRPQDPVEVIGSHHEILVTVVPPLSNISTTPSPVNFTVQTVNVTAKPEHLASKLELLVPPNSTTAGAIPLPTAKSLPGLSRNKRQFGYGGFGYGLPFYGYGMPWYGYGYGLPLMGGLGLGYGLGLGLGLGGFGLGFGGLGFGGLGMMGLGGLGFGGLGFGGLGLGGFGGFGGFGGLGMGGGIVDTMSVTDVGF